MPVSHPRYSYRPKSYRKAAGAYTDGRRRVVRNRLSAGACSRGLAFESGTTIDFEKYSILAIMGWSLQNIDSIIHRFTDDDGLYF